MSQTVILIYNPNAGTLLAQGEGGFLPFLHDVLRDYPQVVLKPLAFTGDNLADLDATIAAQQPDVLWVAGGDGTVLMAAKLAMQFGIPLGILPGGTMNLLARDLGMDLDMAQAVVQLVHGTPGRIDVAYLNDEPFLCIANLGLSTRVTKRREALRQYPAWLRWPIVALAAVRDLFVYPVLRLQFTVDGETFTVRTRSVSISNNPLDKDSAMIPTKPALNDGLLGLYVIRENSVWSLPRLVARLMQGTWAQDQDLLQMTAQTITVTFRQRRPLRVMTDGELGTLPSPLHFSIQSGALPVIMPGSQV